MSDVLADHAARLEALEALITHQDQLITELNEVVTSQWRKIDALERQVAQLLEEIRNIGPAREGPEPPPPHY